MLHVAVTEHQRRVIQLLCGDTAWTWTCLPWLRSCWSVVADTLVLIRTPVTLSVGQLQHDSSVASYTRYIIMLLVSFCLLYTSDAADES